MTVNLMVFINDILHGKERFFFLLQFHHCELMEFFCDSGLCIAVKNNLFFTLICLNMILLLNFKNCFRWGFLRLRLSHEITPLHLTHPGWHLLNTHMHMLRVTHSWRQMPYAGAVGGHSQHPGSMRVWCLAQGHVGRGNPNLPAVSSPIFLSSESVNRTANCQSYWTTHSHHWANTARILQDMLY